EIGNYAFYECRKLSKVTFEDSEQTLHIGYQPSTWDDVGPFWQSPLTEINIYRELAYDNDDVRTDEGLFANSHRGELVTKVDMGGHFRTILPFMFSYSAVGGTVINGNTVAGSVWIPHTVTSIGNYAFLNCNRLAGLTMGYDGTTEFPSIGTYVFESCEKFYYIKVRKSQLKKFQDSTQWDTYEEMLKNGFTTGDDLP
ncbi:MAG: leucine-rich repeat protein, partial [Alistipes sp.]|nr:leucine-rich repeat protein [Alistipes sp.]